MACRVRHKRDFEQVYKKGSRYYSKSLVIIALEVAAPTNRLGLAITRKLEKRASARNRIKRYVREIYRRDRSLLKGNFDLVVLARKDTALCSYAELRRQFRACLMYHGLLARPVANPVAKPVDS